MHNPNPRWSDTLPWPLRAPGMHVCLYIHAWKHPSIYIKRKVLRYIIKSLYDGVVSSDHICYYRNREFANCKSPQSLAKKNLHSICSLSNWSIIRSAVFLVGSFVKNCSWLASTVQARLPPEYSSLTLLSLHAKPGQTPQFQPSG